MAKRFHVFVLLYFGISGCGGGKNPAAPTVTTDDPAPAPVSAVLVGAGDIADCGPGAEETAKLLDELPFATIFTAGDHAYPFGREEDFARCYEPTWGRHKARTYPSPGNHDYDRAGSAPYYAYFGANAGAPGVGYYRYVLGSWQIYSLNSNAPAGPRSPQYEWLARELDVNRFTCTLAYWHHPVVSSGRNGDQPQMLEIWRLLHARGAEVVINGHDHLYERFAPQDGELRYDPDRGIREFIVGTGGARLYEFGRVKAWSEIRIRAWGVLTLTLSPNRYAWEFVSNGARDGGTDDCH